jgi:hypothetical protein
MLSLAILLKNRGLASLFPWRTARTFAPRSFVCPVSDDTGRGQTAVDRLRHEYTGRSCFGGSAQGRSALRASTVVERSVSCYQAGECV